MSRARHGIAFVVGSLIPIAGHAAAVDTEENPFRMEEFTQGNMWGQDAGETMMAQGYCGGMQEWQGGYGGMYCGAGMPGMRGGMMGGPMMGGGMMGAPMMGGVMMCGGMMGGGMGMMRMMDTDQDGKISKEEMAKHQEWMM